MTSSSINAAIREQRETLTTILGEPMRRLAAACVPLLADRQKLETLLTDAMMHKGYCEELAVFCKHLYILDARGIQIVDNITRDGPDTRHFGRDRSARPYMLGILGSTDFKLSDAYISRNRKLPMLTAVQVIRDEGQHVGYLGADFDLRELPGTQGLYRDAPDWQQIKGDPAIRGGLFMQQRATSALDERIDDILAIMRELMVDRGIFHGKLHFSSSRATVWALSDPFAYRLLGIDELTDPDVCLAYPRCPYPEQATIPASSVEPVFALFKELRFADDTIYLRAGSLNVVNGMVGLNFSCDGSHYLHCDDFLNKGIDFWLGTLR